MRRLARPALIIAVSLLAIGGAALVWRDADRVDARAVRNSPPQAAAAPASSEAAAHESDHPGEVTSTHPEAVASTPRDAPASARPPEAPTLRRPTATSPRPDLETQALTDPKRRAHLLLAEYDALLAELQAELARDPAAAELAALYHDQFAQAIAADVGDVALQVVGCGRRICVIEMTSESGDWPRFGLDAEGRSNLPGLQIGAVEIAAPGAPRTRRVVIAPYPSPGGPGG